MKNSQSKFSNTKSAMNLKSNSKLKDKSSMSSCCCGGSKANSEVDEIEEVYVEEK